MTAQVVRYAFEAWESHGDSMIIRSSASLTVGWNISSARGSSSDHWSVAPALFTAGCRLASLTWNAVAALNAIWPVGKCAPAMREMGWTVDDGGQNKDSVVKWTLRPPELAVIPV